MLILQFLFYLSCPCTSFLDHLMYTLLLLQVIKSSCFDFYMCIILLQLIVVILFSSAAPEWVFQGIINKGIRGNRSSWRWKKRINFNDFSCYNSCLLLLLWQIPEVDDTLQCCHTYGHVFKRRLWGLPRHEVLENASEVHASCYRAFKSCVFCLLMLKT